MDLLVSDGATILARLALGEAAPQALDGPGQSPLVEGLDHIVQRGQIEGLDRVAEVAPWFAGGWQIRMADAAGTRIQVSRRYARRLRQQGLWD